MENRVGEQGQANAGPVEVADDGVRRDAVSGVSRPRGSAPRPTVPEEDTHLRAVPPRHGIGRPTLNVQPRTTSNLHCGVRITHRHEFSGCGSNM